MRTFKNFIKKQKEIEIDGYKTKYHYMCPSAVRFFKKHERMDHSEDEKKALQDVVRLSDDVFEIEAEELQGYMKKFIEDVDHKYLTDIRGGQ